MCVSVCVCLTLRPLEFSTLGFLEKCILTLPSSLSVTATFFSVWFPQWGQNTLFMLVVVLMENQ